MEIIRYVQASQKPDIWFSHKYQQDSVYKIRVWGWERLGLFHKKFPLSCVMEKGLGMGMYVLIGQFARN